MGSQLHPQKRGTAAPTFWPMSIMAKRLDRSRCHLCGGRSPPRPHCVRWERSSLPKIGHSSPSLLISAHVYCGQKAGWIRITYLLTYLHLAWRRPRRTSDGNPAPTPKMGHSCQFSAHVCCGPMAGWIKMPLATAVSFGLGHVVLDGYPASPPRKRPQQPPLFGPCLLQPNGRPSQQLLSFFTFILNKKNS